MEVLGLMNKAIIKKLSWLLTIAMALSLFAGFPLTASAAEPELIAGLSPSTIFVSSNDQTVELKVTISSQKSKMG